MADIPVLQVKMFGGFQVTCGEHVIVSPETRNSKVIQLLQYLLCNRGKMILQEELIDALLHDDYGSNPVGTLKNIVYRLRKLFIGAELDKSCILYNKNRYGFSPDIPCEIDAEQFFAIVRRVRHAQLDDETRFALCMEAAGLYKSDFLARSSSEPWVMGRSSRYQEQILRADPYCVRDRRTRQTACQGSAPAAARHRALPLQREELCLMHISCLFEMGHCAEAIAEYNKVADTLYNDLGARPSQTMRNLYRRIAGSMQRPTDCVHDVRTASGEPECFTGAYYCNFENFINFYQFIVRHKERNGQSIYIMLCTLTETDNSQPKSGERLRNLSTSMHKGRAPFRPARGRVHPIQPFAVFAYAYEYQSGKLSYRGGQAAVQFFQAFKNYKRPP